MATREDDETGQGPGPQAHYPERREVLGCDFTGLRYPEMNKNRPVVIVSCSPARPNLALVVPLSSTEPVPMHPWHHMLSRQSSWDRRERWAKCDMLYAVTYERLSLWKLGKEPNGKRRYLTNYLIAELDFERIQVGILAALNIRLK